MDPLARRRLGRSTLEVTAMIPAGFRAELKHERLLPAYAPVPG